MGGVARTRRHRRRRRQDTDSADGKSNEYRLIFWGGGGGEKRKAFIWRKRIFHHRRRRHKLCIQVQLKSKYCAEWIQKKGGFDTVGLIKSIQTKEDDPGMVPTMKRNDTLEVYLVCVEILSLKKYCLIEQLLPRFHTGTN